MRYKRIPVTADMAKMEKAFKQWSGEKTAAKAFVWALRFAYRYKTIEEKIENNNSTNSDTAP